MTALSGETVVDIATARSRALSAPRPRTIAWKNTRRDNVVLAVPRSVRRVRDVVWTAIISIVLASAAVLAGVVGPFVGLDLTPMVEGLGLASIAFGLAGLSDKFDPHSRSQD